MENKEFAAEKVMPTVVRETNRKLMECGVKTVLSIQDTTEVEYKTNAKGLGNIGTEPSLKGLLVHSAIAVTTNGSDAWKKQAVVLTRIYVRYRFATEKEIFSNCSRKQKMKNKSI